MIGIEEAATAADERARAIFSWMFVFSAALVAGYVAIATKRTGARRAILAAITFVLSYAIFWSILHFEP